MWDEITNPFPNFNGAAVEVWEWISSLIPLFIGPMITYPLGQIIDCRLFSAKPLTWTNADLSIGPLGTNFSEIWIKLQNFSFIRMHLKMLSAKWQPFFEGETQQNITKHEQHISWDVMYHKTSNISRTLVGNKIVDNSDVVGASPVGAAPTASSFST